jgi:hypothetical protein
MRLVFKIEDNIHIFRLGTTTNKKICSDPKENIVQTYAFSMQQYDYVSNGGGSLKEFFDLANSNCIDCPMRSYGKCYTHKFTQARGFLSMLRSIAKEYDVIPNYSEEIHNKVVNMCVNKYVRFGTYGEPVLHGINLTTDVTNVAKSWTGYTHQWLKHPQFKGMFMASVHSPKIEQVARDKGWRSFITIGDHVSNYVNCPASEEGGRKASCDKCGLCSGADGKGNKSIYILEH